MTLTISENKKKVIATYINDHFNEYMSHFPYAKYPVEPLEQWRITFTDPKTVRPEVLRAALSWRGGYWQRKDAPYSHRQAALCVAKSWPEFAREEAPDPARTFDFWMERLPSHLLAFETASFLAHLLHPDALEMADEHRFVAMQDLLKEALQKEGEQGVDSSLNGLVLYTDFFRALLPKIQAKHGEGARVQLDRFLKAYGNRHALAKLAGKIPPTIEPTIRSLDWEAIDCSHFAPERIEGRANADVLFACLLLALEEKPERKKKLTVGEVAELVPLGSGAICNPSSYHYAMIALFGGQKGRDFFSFDDEQLRAAFTDQANQSSRNMRFYREHSEAVITINPKYVRP